MSGKDSPGMEYLKRLTRAEHAERTRRLWKQFVLYLCPQCKGGVWYAKTGELDYLPDGFPCGNPCFGTMVKQREPQFWEAEQGELGQGAQVGRRDETT